jgi:gentisate 1,2-dioxygenase
MEKFKPLSEEESKNASPITSKVYDALSKKAMHEMRRVDRSNPAFFGGVKFFFMETENGPYLVWDTHVNDWNETKIKEDIDALEYQIAKSKGLID